MLLTTLIKCLNEMNAASENVTNETPQVKLPPKVRDVTGRIFTRLTVMGFSHVHGRSSYWKCQCECSAIVVVRRNSLTGGNTQSCGCLQKERAAAFLSNLERRATFNHGTHKQSGSPEHTSWASMKQRCLNPATKAFKYYGGRGIKICERWMLFENFLADMGEKPSPKHTIDRINTNGNYEKENCWWATRKEQQNNMRSNRNLTLNGRTQTMAQWVKESGMKYCTLFGRIRKGMSLEEAMSRPLYKRTIKA